MAAGGDVFGPGVILPNYQRYFGANQSQYTQRRAFRTREKYLIILVLMTFSLVCFGAFFYLPEDMRPNSRLVYRSVYQSMKKAGPELLIPVMPQIHNLNTSKLSIVHHDPRAEDIYLLKDKQKLQAKIDEDDMNQKVLDKPETMQQTRSEKSNLSTTQMYQSWNDIPKAQYSRSADDSPKVTGGEDPDPVTRQRREKVKEMMKHGWNNYVRYAWGKNELRPISKRAHSASIFGSSMIGATIVDGLDTLYIMGLHEEFKHGRDWIEKNLNFDIDSDMSLFELNIRFLGSLLANYALTGDEMFKEKARQLGERMLPAFKTETGIPHSLINLHTGRSKNYAWASNGCSILSEIGTMHLEFIYLSDITGNPIYREKVMQIRRTLNNLDKPNGLYPNYINPRTGTWGRHHMSLGGLGDSFYEYLLKAWIQSGKTDREARQMYDEAMDAIMTHMILKSPGGLLYASDIQYERVEHKMGHLACFAGGMFGLGAKNDNEVNDRHMEVASGLTNTCHESYIRTPTKLGPEAFHFIEGSEAKSLKNGEKYYILRPETFESYFVMWRLTKDPKYREWGWDAVQALEKHCRVPGGYTGLHNVYQEDSPKDDVQQSYFFAETLKYLYLLFSDDDLISLDQWVFNSEAHAFPVRGKNTLYRSAPVDSDR
ncbi:hypothetical protein TKK_0002697 [Trichogramma kaykai]|uniref:alpha-1,2-Mannosidase n=1 Tax=Trichogramma kaykai TaxID=54128 RepID=A0ABD2XSE6_9HYME